MKLKQELLFLQWRRVTYWLVRWACDREFEVSVSSCDLEQDTSFQVASVQSVGKSCDRPESRPDGESMRHGNRPLCVELGRKPTWSFFSLFH